MLKAIKVLNAPEFGNVPEPTDHLPGEEIRAQLLDVKLTFTHTHIHTHTAPKPDV